MTNLTIIEISIIISAAIMIAALTGIICYTLGERRTTKRWRMELSSGVAKADIVSETGMFMNIGCKFESRIDIVYYSGNHEKPVISVIPGSTKKVPFYPMPPVKEPRQNVEASHRGPDSVVTFHSS